MIVLSMKSLSRKMKLNITFWLFQGLKIHLFEQTNTQVILNGVIIPFSKWQIIQWAFDMIVTLQGWLQNPHLTVSTNSKLLIYHKLCPIFIMPQHWVIYLKSDFAWSTDYYGGGFLIFCVFLRLVVDRCYPKIVSRNRSSNEKPLTILSTFMKIKQLRQITKYKYLNKSLYITNERRENRPIHLHIPTFIN